MRRSEAERFARFLVVGVSNVAVYYACYLLLHVVLPYLAAHVLAYAFSVVTSFFLTTRFTFRVAPTARRAAVFPLVYGVNIVATSVMIVVMVQGLGIGERVAPLVSAALAVPLTFLTARLLLLDRTGTATS
jgi:putative flippase GtrA